MSRFRFEVIREAGMVRLTACLAEMNAVEVDALATTHADTTHDGVMDSDCPVCVVLAGAQGVDLTRP